MQNNSNESTTDILNCLSNLSNDEVFTPPEIVNKMLDMLPQTLFQSKDTKFLDPCSKSGVFLREIVKRLNVGLKSKIPNLQKRIDWILKNQVFGIPLTELTYHLTKRSLYCSIHVNGKFCITNAFDKNNKAGNICSKIGQHTFRNKKCIICGFPEEMAENRTEKHAYYFIHCKKPEEIFNMKFDVIIGNPPYQLDDGGAQASAKPIYHLFIETAKKLKPRYISMIVPSRWMTGGKGLDKFRDMMVHDKHIITLHDFPDTSECFPGVSIPGGVCYFLYSRDHESKCDIYRHNSGEVFHSKRYLVESGDDIFIREQLLLSIKQKVEINHETTAVSIVSARKPYGLEAETMLNASKYGLPEFSEKPINGGYKILGLGSGQKRMWKFLPKSYPIPKINSALNKYKVFIAEAYGCPAVGEVDSTPVLSTPVLGCPNELCTETFLQIGPFNTKKEAENFIKYIKTKFFRALVGIQKQTQHTTQKAYRFVPLLNFSSSSDINWDDTVENVDKQLFKRYKLDKKEIEFIQTKIKQME